jgi:hypothetical protein
VLLMSELHVFPCGHFFHGRIFHLVWTEGENSCTYVIFPSCVWRVINEDVYS